MKKTYDAYEIMFLGNEDLIEGADLSNGIMTCHFKVYEANFESAALVFFDNGYETHILKNRYGKTGKVV